MSKPCRHLIPPVLACLLVAALGNAQQYQGMPASDLPPPPTVEDAVQRKTPSWFHRAKRDTPREQMAYAREMEEKGRLGKARRAYSALVHTWHGSAEAPTAQLRHAVLLAEKGSYKRAFEEFQYLVDFFGSEFPYKEVMEHQLKIANHVMARRRLQVWGLPGFRSPERAIPLFQSIVENAPEADRAAELQYRVGVLQEDDKAYNDAIRSFTAVQSNYPESTFAADAAFRKARCRRVLAVRRRNNEKGLREAAAAFQDYLHRYPSHSHEAAATEALNALNERVAALYWDRAVFYHEAAGEPHAARVAYLELVEKYPEASMADEARKRAEELKGVAEGPAE